MREERRQHLDSIGARTKRAPFAVSSTLRVESVRLNSNDSEVHGHMTANWASVVVNVLILAFFVVCAIGVGLGAYAATELKKAEDARKEA